MRRFGRISLRAVAGALVALLVAGIASLLVVRSGWLRELVRARIVQELERATGGRAELGQFAFDWRSMTAHVESLVVHGNEGPADPPFLRAGAVTLGLRVISALERDVDLASLTVERPEVHIIFYPDGSNNVPSPGRGGERNWAEHLLSARIGQYEIRDGFFEIDQRRAPLNLSGRNLRVRMSYDPSGPAYRGEASSEPLRILFTAAQGPIEVSFSGDFALDKDGLTFPRLDVARPGVRANLRGALADVRSPRGTFDVRADIAVSEAVRTFELPVGPQGSAVFEGKLAVDFAPGFGFIMNGRVAARGLGYVRDRLHIEDGSLRANVQLSKDRLTLREIEGEALNTAITGNVELVAWRRFAMQGNIQGMGLRRAAGILTGHAIAWSGTLSGPFRLEATLGESEARAQANLTVTRGGDGVPVEGHLDVAYDQAAGIVGLGSSWLATPETRLDVSGTLGQVLRVRLRTTEPEDLLPALAMAQADAPEHLPLKLTSSGTATAEGTVTGPLDELHFEGPVTVVNGEVQGHQFSRFAADVAADRREIRASRLTLSRGAMETTGSANLAARNGSFDDATLSAALSARSLALAELAREFGLNTPVSGTASATARVSGSVRAPEAEIQADVDRPEAFGEQFSRLRATLRYKPDSLEVAGGEAQDGTATVQFGGVYRPAAGGWKSGELSFDAATQNLPLQRIDRVAAIQPPVDALVTGRVRGSVRISENEILPRTLTADLAADRVAVDRQNAGTFSLGVETRGNEIQALITGRVRESAIEARGVWTLAGDYPGTATINVSRMSIATVHSLSMLGSGAELHEDDVPFEGFLEGGAALSIPLRSLKDFSARVTLAAVQVNPKPNQALRLGVEPQDIVLRNERPVVVEITPQEARIAQAQFTGRDTSLQVSGAIPFGAGRSADVAVRGNINLILLQLLNRDLLARGEASMQAAVRGEIRDPVVNGRLELKNASLYFGDLPQGIDNANGSILFDRNRASVEKLTAQTGGGTLAVSGLVEFGSTLVYRLQADARQVRVRWPEDLSTTFNARLGLSGTPEATTLSGTVTLNRAAFTPRTDLGQLLAQASKPAPALATPNELLRGLQFNVRVESAPNFTFETSLTRDVEADVDLNLRGTPTRPVLLGAISVNQGELQVFGNRYTIDRGEVRFLNPVKIEPTFDMDLATRARGITVNVSFSGTVQQLKVNYSSDPPLQSSEIIALLAVGRDPTTANTTTVNPSATSGLVEAGSSLIGQAANAQLSSRLQRFFGASRVKIDPTLTGVDNLPQARLTIEQQVSRDITLTYITNLNRTQEQLVRVQWDLNRNWSAIAVRDPNGLFGVDFQFRTRF